MMRKVQEFDWAKSTYDLLGSRATRLADLVRDAGLNPRAGDVSHIDLRGVDLQWEDLRGWDLSFATFENALIFGTNFEGAKIEPSAILEAKGWIGARFDRNIRDLLHSLYEQQMRQDLLHAGAGQVLDGLELYLTYADESDDQEMSEQKMARKLLEDLRRQNEIFDHFVYDLSSEELHFISMIAFHIEDVLRKEEDSYIITLCNSILGEEASRDHTFYDPGNSNVRRHFDAYYHGLKLVVELKKSEHSSRTSIVEQWLRQQDLNVFIIYKNIFEFSKDGIIKKNISKDRSALEIVIRSQFPQIVPIVD